MLAVPHNTRIARVIEQSQSAVQTTTDEYGLRFVLLQFVDFVRVELKKLQITQNQRSDKVKVIRGMRRVVVKAGHLQALIQEVGHRSIVQEARGGADRFVTHQVEHFAIVGWWKSVNLYIFLVKVSVKSLEQIVFDEIR